MTQGTMRYGDLNRSDEETTYLAATPLSTTRGERGTTLSVQSGQPSGDADPTEAIRGLSTDESGVGVVGEAQGDSGTGVDGLGGLFGVNGFSSSGYGVWGSSSTGIGVLGRSTDLYGVLGRSRNSFAGYFIGPPSTNGSSGGLYVSGNIVKVNGEYSEALLHPDGSRRLMYASLSPESWYEDFGRGELVEGRGRVALDPDFAAILGIDDGDYHVFLTPEGDSNGLYVSRRNASAFEVHEQQEGRSSISFSYQVVAVNKRKDGRSERLATVAVVEEPESIDFDRQEEEHRRPVDELRRLVEEQRREIEELRRRVGPQEDAPPETT
jgi:hypothetical protein